MGEEMQDPYLHQILSELLTVLHLACNISSKELECVQDKETKRAVKGKKGGKDILCRHSIFMDSIYSQ